METAPAGTLQPSNLRSRVTKTTTSLLITDERLSNLPQQSLQEPSSSIVKDRKAPRALRVAGIWASQMNGWTKVADQNSTTDPITFSLLTEYQTLPSPKLKTSRSEDPHGFCRSLTRGWHCKVTCRYTRSLVKMSPDSPRPKRRKACVPENPARFSQCP